MSRLQEEVKPFLVPMLLGQPTQLHKRAQRTVAAWATVMVMVGEYVQRDMVAIPQSDRDFIREEKLPPMHWRLWIGAHYNQTFALYTHNVQELSAEAQIVLDERECKPNTHATTICLGGSLFVHAMSSVPAKRIVRRWRHSKFVASALHQIWPIDDPIVRWSADVRLTDDGLDVLANQLLNASNALLREKA